MIQFCEPINDKFHNQFSKQFMQVGIQEGSSSHLMHQSFRMKKSLTLYNVQTHNYFHS